MLSSPVLLLGLPTAVPVKTTHAIQADVSPVGVAAEAAVAQETKITSSKISIKREGLNR